MQGLVVSGGQVSLVDGIAEPTPAAGQVLVRPLLTGVCGSDLHAPKLQIADPGSWPEAFVLGHEYVAEVVDYGPGCEKKIPVGAKVGSVPYVDHAAEGPQLIGFSGVYPGSLSDMLVLQEDRLIQFSDDVPVEHSVLTEPLAVGFHAVNRTDVRPGDAILVLGCGPVGLSVIAALKAKGLGPIVAADYSAKRREIAESLGVDAVLDPGADDPYGRWIQNSGDPMPPSPLLDGLGRAPSVLFDCVGVPGLMQKHYEMAPNYSRITNVGVCMEPDTVMPVMAISKELRVQNVFAYTSHEYAESYQAISTGAVDVSKWVTANRPLSEAEGAFADLAAPDNHCKVVIHPN